MNILENYISELLNEDKPIGAKNRELWLNYLEKRYMFRDDIEDYFVTFVSEDKVGINPNSVHKTPNGVYTYPVAWVLDNQVPFRGREKPKKIKVIKAISNKVLDVNLSDSNYKKSVEKLSNEYKDRFKYDVEKYLDSFESMNEYETNFKKLWKLTFQLKKNSNDWTMMLIKLGFDWANDNGEGVIHNNEPTQAVFLNPKSYKVVGEEFVDTEERYVSTNKALTFSQLSHILLDSDSTKIYQFLINSKEVIKKIIDKNNWLKFVDIITNVLYSSTNDFGTVERHKIIKIYSDIINSAIKSTNYQYVKNLNYIKKEKDISDFVSIFEIHDTYTRIVKKYLSNYDEDLFEYIPQKIVIDDCFSVIYDLIRSKDVAFLNMFTKENLEIIYQECKKEIDELYKSKEKQLPSKLLKIIEKDS